MSTAWISPETASLCPSLSWEGLHYGNTLYFQLRKYEENSSSICSLNHWWITIVLTQYGLDFWGQRNRELELCLVHQTFPGVTVGVRVLGHWHHGSDLLWDPWCPSFPGQPLAAKESKFHWCSGMSHPPPWSYIQRLWVTAYMGWWWKVLSKD